MEPLAPKAMRPAGTRIEASENAAYFQKVMIDFNLVENSALLLNGTRKHLAFLTSS